ncbi:MAG: hypothetical protein KIT14_10140 [bacterium]|nr:hypothetical protein [bacterium]
MTLPHLLLLAVALLAVALPVAAQPLRRDLGAYALLAMRRAALKDITVAGTCNVGVNCGSPSPGSDCGILRMDDATFADGSQAAGDRTFQRAGSVFFQLFRNGGGPLVGVTVNQPPIASFATPILPATCGASCAPDYAAIEASCGFPVPFPACAPARRVVAAKNADCAFDIRPGNGMCDLAPGAYGTIEVRNGATVLLASGAYVACDLRVSRKARVLGEGIVLDVGPGGGLRVGSGSQVGQDCGDLVVHLAGLGPVTFGRNARIAAQICAPRADVRLGHANVIVGQVIADAITSDASNDVQCCGGRCACVDDVTPDAASPGQTVLLATRCDLSAATAVRICGRAAHVLARSPSTLEVVVPAGAAGACRVEVDSPAGTWEHGRPLQVG